MLEIKEFCYNLSERAQVARLHFFSGRKLCVWQSETQTHLKSSNSLTLGALNKLLLDCSHHPEAVARWRWASHQPEELVNHSWMESHELVLLKIVERDLHRTMAGRRIIKNLFAPFSTLSLPWL